MMQDQVGTRLRQLRDEDCILINHIHRREAPICEVAKPAALHLLREIRELDATVRQKDAIIGGK